MEIIFNPIVFPSLGISVDPNPIAAEFNIFGMHLSVHWYGVIIACGFVLGILYAVNISKKVGISEDTVLDFILITAPLSIIGARVYYIIFPPKGSHFDTFYEKIAIWEGGIAIYGAILTGFLVCFIYCRKKKIPFLKFADILVPGLMIGQIIGRWGNFINREAYGGLYDGFLRMEITLRENLTDAAGNILAFAGERAPVHPTFLYESAWNLLGLILLHNYSKHKKKEGEITLLYIGWYGFGRAFIEGLRSDSLTFLNTGIRVSQMVGIASVLICIIGMILLYRIKEKPIKQ